MFLGKGTLIDDINFFGRVGVLVLCSYITLPLYALITQMGSNMKKSIFDEQTSKALKKWHMAVKKKKEGRGERSSGTLGGSPMASPVHPSGPTLHRFKTTGHSTRAVSYEEQESSDLELDASSPTSSSMANLLVRVDQDVPLVETTMEDQTKKEDGFSFVKPGL